MSDTTDSSQSFPTLSHIGDALSDITTADSESAIHPPTLSGIAKELLLAEARYTTEEAGLRKQIEELKLTVQCQAKLVADQYVEIKRQGEVIKSSDSRIATLITQRDTLQSKEHQLHSPNRTIHVPISPSSRIYEDSPTTTADIPAKLLPTPKTTLTTPDNPVISPTPKPYQKSKFEFDKPNPFFTFGDPTPVYPPKSAVGLTPHHTHTRSKSAEPRASPAMTPISSQKPSGEPDGWNPEDWKKYLRLGPPTAENVFELGQCGRNALPSAMQASPFTSTTC